MGAWAEVGVAMSTSAATPEDLPTDPDVDLHIPAQRAERMWDPATLGAIAIGGVLGAESRYALSVWWSNGAGGWPGATWWINLSGSLLLGALMVALSELTAPHHLARPFFGVGVLGGYTTFSTAMVDVHQLLQSGRQWVAVGYLFGTAAAALIAVFVGSIGARAVIAGWRRRASGAR